MQAKLTLAVVVAAFAAMCVLTTCGGSGRRAVVQPQERVAPPGRAAVDESLDDALAELEGMECPEGVDEELWEELKGALEEALNCRVETIISGAGVSPANHLNHGRDARATSIVPTGDENRITDLTLTDHFDATYTLSWHYQNLGDYDQDGTVGISDITPLAIHYNEEVPEEDDERVSIQAVVDGSGNDIVDIADITPIAMNYGTCCAEYSIRAASSNPESIEDTEEVGAALIALAEGDDRKLFSVELTEEPRIYIAVAPMDADETPGELSNMVMIPNHPPVAELTAYPTEGDAPLEVSFGASGSNDIDGPIVSYEWDWEGDGVYDHDSGSVAEAEHTYDIAQAYDPQVRVTDEHNGTDTAEVTVTVGDWHIFVAVEEACSCCTDMEVVNGHPAICYITPYTLGEELVYVRATDALGTTWGEPVVVDDGDEDKVGPRASLAVVNGRPAIAYYSFEDHKLKYVRALDANGDSWGSPLVLANAGVSLLTLDDVRLLVVDQNPAIAYSGHDPDGLAYIRALDVDGDSWGSPILPAYYGSFESLCSMAIVNGKPAISYFDDNPDDNIKYVRANDTSGGSWGTPAILDYMVGRPNFLAVINGNPAVSYTYYTEDDRGGVKYVRALDANGSIWGTPLIVDSTLEGPAGIGWPILASINGYPAISYTVISGDVWTLNYVQAADPDGTSWHNPMTVDLLDVGGGVASMYIFASMAEVNGHPAIGYYFPDPVMYAIKYAVYY